MAVVTETHIFVFVASIHIIEALGIGQFVGVVASYPGPPLKGPGYEASRGSSSYKILICVHDLVILLRLITL